MLIANVLCRLLLETGKAPSTSAGFMNTDYYGIATRLVGNMMEARKLQRFLFLLSLVLVVEPLMDQVSDGMQICPFQLTFC